MLVFCSGSCGLEDADSACVSDAAGESGLGRSGLLLPVGGRGRVMYGSALAVIARCLAGVLRRLHLRLICKRGLAYPTDVKQRCLIGVLGTLVVGSAGRESASESERDLLENHLT